MSNRTYSARPADVKRAWHVIDVSDKVLGRAASQIATILKGKHKPIYTPSLDTGDHVIVINAAKVKVTGSKETNKLYHRHPRAGFPGALKTTNLADLRARHPEDIVINAVRRMLPRNALGRKMMTKLKVYAGDQHPHAAQKPEARQVEA
jgi:large subunit ribosomal protein L13